MTKISKKGYDIFAVRILINLVLNTLALLVTDWLLRGIVIADKKTAFLAAILMGLINTFIRPILILLTAPLNFLTLGLFTFVINAIVLSMVSSILGLSFVVENFWWAILAAAVLSVVSTVLSSIFSDLTRKR